MSEDIKRVLKPCPFCGGKPKLITRQCMEDCVDSYVECTRCDARTAGCEDAYGDPTYAANEWNTRAAPSASDEKDAKRLDWLMHNLGGKALFAIGVVTSGNCDRECIDAAISANAGKDKEEES